MQEVSPIKTHFSFWKNQYIGDIDKFVIYKQNFKGDPVDKIVPYQPFQMIASDYNYTNSIVNGKLMNHNIIPLIIEEIKDFFRQTEYASLFPYSLIQVKLGGDDFLLTINEDIPLNDYLQRLKSSNKKLTPIFLNELRRLLVFKYFLGFRKNLFKDIYVKFYEVKTFDLLSMRVSYDAVYPCLMISSLNDLDDSESTDLDSKSLDFISNDINMFFGGNREMFLQMYNELISIFSREEFTNTIIDIMKKYNSTFMFKWIVKVLNSIT